VMGVFLGETPNTNAAKAALKINWTVIHLLRPKIEAAYPALSRGGYELKHCVGIDRSEVLVVRSGVREHNDLIWVGRAPNIAAKLAAFRTNHPTYITHDAYSRLHEDVKLGGDPRRSMWEERSWTNPPSPELARIYRSNFWWSL
jgi:class 3 adenylate cyclase